MVRVPKKETALLSDFEVKRDRIAHETLNKNVTNISGVPSWMLSVLVRVMELSGKKHHPRTPGAHCLRACPWRCGA